MRNRFLSGVLWLTLLGGAAHAQPVPADFNVDQVLQWAAGQQQPGYNNPGPAGQGFFDPITGQTIPNRVWTPDPWIGTNNQRGPNNPGTNWNPDGTWNPNGYQLDPPIQPPQGPYK